MEEDCIVVPGKWEYDTMRECICNVGQGTTVDADPIAATNDDDDDDSLDAFACSNWRSEMQGSAVAGFNSSCSAGPLCEEPIRGIILDW